jgi:hypothetical protein
MRSAKDTRADGERKNWREGDARRALDELAASGLTVGTFARGRGIPPTRLRWWRKRLGESVSAVAMESPRSTTEFVPVEIRPARSPLAVLEVVVRADMFVRVPVDFDEDMLVRLIRTLEKAC